MFRDSKEIVHNPPSGVKCCCLAWIMILVSFVMIALVVTVSLVFLAPMIILFICGCCMLCGTYTVEPNDARVLMLFGEYKGTVKSNGLFWVNPFYEKTSVSLKAQNMQGQVIKVNDKGGNPIEIAVVIVWQVEDTYRAKFDVDNYYQYVNVQSEAAVRHLAGMYPYDTFDDNDHELLTLRAGQDEVR